MVIEGMRRCLGCTLCQKRLSLSWKVDECKHLPRAQRHRPRQTPCPSTPPRYGRPDTPHPPRHVMLFLQRDEGGGG